MGNRLKEHGIRYGDKQAMAIPLASSQYYFYFGMAKSNLKVKGSLSLQLRRAERFFFQEGADNFDMLNFYLGLSSRQNIFNYLFHTWLIIVWHVVTKLSTTLYT